MWLNSTQREEPYLGLTCGLRRGDTLTFGSHTGGAWLSSARVVRCWVKSRNERNPRRVLVRKNLSHETADEKSEEGGDDVKSAWPLRLGLHTCYNGRDNEFRARKGKAIS